MQTALFSDTTECCVILNWFYSLIYHFLWLCCFLNQIFPVTDCANISVIPSLDRTQEFRLCFLWKLSAFTVRTRGNTCFTASTGSQAKLCDRATAGLFPNFTPRHLTHLCEQHENQRSHSSTSSVHVF